jgi:hypothetical protein
MQVVLSDYLRRGTPPAIHLWKTQGWLRMSPAVRLLVVGRAANKDSPVGSAGPATSTDLKFTPDLNPHGDWPIKNTSTSL